MLPLRADLCSYLFPGAPQLRLEAIDFDPPCITVEVTSTQVTPPCPDCGHAAQRLHSDYVRTLADLPWADMAARILLRVRRFFCDHVACARTTFTERLPVLVAPHARRTRRLARAQADVGLALGGAAGARLTAKQHIPTSRNTLLRLIRREAPPAADPPRVVGLDDWAKRKGQTYGTIVVDLETREPIDLLDDRSAETVEGWLKVHPTVEVVSRDRAEAYASGTTAGAPDAVQVADRFHILKNLREAIEQELGQRGARIGRTVPDVASDPAVPPALRGAAHRVVRVPDERARSASTTLKDVILPGAQRVIAPTPLPDVPTIYPETPAGRRAEIGRQARRSARFAQYTQVVAWHAQGLDQPTIARRVGISKRTVARWLTARGFPERKPRSGDASGLDPYKAYLLESWRAGCHNGMRLWRMIQAEGFAGSYSLVAEYLGPLRRGEAVREGPGTLSPGASVTKEHCYTARQAACLFLRRPTDLTDSEKRDLTHMQGYDAVLTMIYTLTQDFAAMVREHNAERLDQWLAVAATGAFPELQRFANGVRQDYAAVRAGLELPWSQGPVEGHITRLKLVKRQMYGRAKLDLLRQRVLHAA